MHYRHQCDNDIPHGNQHMTHNPFAGRLVLLLQLFYSSVYAEQINRKTNKDH
jgi:hypothetical protein